MNETIVATHSKMSPTKVSIFTSTGTMIVSSDWFTLRSKYKTHVLVKTLPFVHSLTLNCTYN